MKGPASKLASAFGHRIDHREELIGLIIEHEMEVPEMPAIHVPVKVFRFHIERENVCEQLPQGVRDFLGASWG